MKTYLTGVFKNNGVARGWIYFLIPFLTHWGEKLLSWGNKPETFSWYFLGATAFLSLVAGLTAIRAYLDGHLGRQEPKQ